MMTAANIGKTKIDIQARGCTTCGTEHSSGWYQVETIQVQVKTRTIYIGVSQCADCHFSPTLRRKVEPF